MLLWISLLLSAVSQLPSLLIFFWPLFSMSISPHGRNVHLVVESNPIFMALEQMNAKKGNKKSSKFHHINYYSGRISTLFCFLYIIQLSLLLLWLARGRSHWCEIYAEQLHKYTCCRSSMKSNVVKSEEWGDRVTLDCDMKTFKQRNGIIQFIFWKDHCDNTVEINFINTCSIFSEHQKWPIYSAKGISAEDFYSHRVCVSGEGIKI
jgi:hypothetical protein